eukprot:767102-Hanusia_phi.AAC.9
MGTVIGKISKTAAEHLQLPVHIGSSSKSLPLHQEEMWSVGFGSTTAMTLMTASQEAELQPLTQPPAGLLWA